LGGTLAAISGAELIHARLKWSRDQRGFKNATERGVYAASNVEKPEVFGFCNAGNNLNREAA